MQLGTSQAYRGGEPLNDDTPSLHCSTHASWRSMFLQAGFKFDSYSFLKIFRYNKLIAGS